MKYTKCLPTLKVITLNVGFMGTIVHADLGKELHP